MTQSEDLLAINADDWHHLLLRLAGGVGDEVLTDARDWLAAGSPEQTAALVGSAVLAGQVPLWEMDALLLADELDQAGFDLDPLRDLLLIENAGTRRMPWTFAARREGDGPLLLDLTGDPDGLDHLDRAAVTAVQDEPAATGLWRTWRRSDPSGAPKPVYLVQVSRSRSLAATTGRLQSALRAAGESSPQVEVCPVGIVRPDYQEAAWLRSALLWAREPLPSLRTAQAFDTVHPRTGPGFTAGHPRITDPAEVEVLLEYLEGAPVVLSEALGMADVLNPVAGRTVSLSVRTDGEWVWPDSAGYYLREHGLAPDPQLLRHLRSAGARFPRVTDVARHRALAHLLGPSGETPVWTAPAG